MLLHAMAQLIIAQPQRLGGLALIVAMLAKGMFEDCALVGVDRAAQIFDGIELHLHRHLGDIDSGLLTRLIGARQGGGFPRAVERIEHDMGK